MGDVVVGHRQDGDLGDRALAGADAACAFVQRGQVAIQISRIPFAAGDFAADVRDLAQGFAVVGHIGENHQDVHPAFIGEVLGQCQRRPGSNDTLHRGVICQVEEHRHPCQGSAFGEGTAEVVRYVIFDTHGGKYNRELLCFAIGFGASEFSKGCLAHDLSCELVMGQAGAGEDRQLLAAQKGI